MVDYKYKSLIVEIESIFRQSIILTNKIILFINNYALTTIPKV